MAINTPIRKSKAPYFLGILCLFPLIGAFVGLGLLIYSLAYYKDKWLTIIGAFGILFTIIIYSLFFYAANNLNVFKQSWVQITQMQLNSLVKNIEFYKLQNGVYPDSLKQLLIDDKVAPIHDQIAGMKSKRDNYFNYRKVNDNYTLFSSGPDGIPNTKDDLYPIIIINDSSRIGFRKYK